MIQFSCQRTKKLYRMLCFSCCRDLKPANILLKHTDAAGGAAVGKLDLPSVDVPHGLAVKVTDFGFSRRLHLESFTMTQLGTLLYMAPEVISKEGRYGNKADLYSLGVIAYELATLQTATLDTDRGMIHTVEWQDVFFVWY